MLKAKHPWQNIQFVSYSEVNFPRHINKEINKTHFSTGECLALRREVKNQKGGERTFSNFGGTK